MIRKLFVVLTVVVGLSAPASAWADTSDSGSRTATAESVAQAAADRGASADTLDEVMEVVGAVDPDQITIFCMLGWRGTIYSNSNGVVSAHGEPSADCPIFGYFIIL